MKVICKFNNLNSLSDKKVLERLRKNIFNPEGEVDLVVGREYTVYGIIFMDNSPWYYLCAEEDDNYPVPFAAEFFEVFDDRLSSYWKLLVYKQSFGEMLSLLLFDEWAKDYYFYEHLLDGYPENIKLFLKYRRLMDQE